MTNDGKANVTEYFYSDKQLKRSEGKPLADILKSIKQTLYSGEYKDTTGLAQVEEVNAGTLNRIELLRDGDVVYGAAVGGRIYLNAERLNPNTPVHEYTHLWDKACKAKNPELWNRGVELMKQTSIWNEVADDANYSGLGEHGIASEVHSRLAGNQGEELLTKMSADVLAQGGSMMEKAQKLSVIELLKDWVKDFWSWVRDAMTPWSREETQKVSLEEFVSMPIASLAQAQKEELKKRGIPFVETDNNGKPRYSISEARVFTEEEIAQMETPILESKGTFKNLNEAEKWATTNLQGKSAVNEFTKERISIGRKSVEKMLSEKSQNQSISISAHIAALQSVLDFIRTGIPAEIHSDVKGREFSVMRLYNAIVIDGELYRVKSTVRKVAQGDKYYTYEIQEMEVIEERQANWKGEGINPRNPDNPIKSISGKDLLRGVKKTDSDELILSVANVENKFEKTNYSITEHFAQAERYANLMSGDVQALNSDKMTDSLLDAYLSLPENIREEVIRLAPRKGYNFADAFAQYLADKVESEEEFTADDWTAVTANRDALKKAYALDDLSLYDALWMTVQKAYPGKDILSRAHKVTLADNLGVDAESDEMKQIARQGVNYSISENMKSSSAAETYARATGYFKNRLKEGFVDMNESVNDLVEAIEMATGSKAESWEDIRYALNQQSSKGLARMEQYTRRYLQPLFDLLADITNNTKLSYEDVSRYVILRHAIERNEVFAKRDARRHYQEVYNAMAAPLEKDKGMLQADRRVALSKADMRKVADIDRRIADIDKQLNAAKLNLAVHLDDINKGNDAIYLKNRETDYGGLTSMFSDYPGLQPRSKYRTDEEYNRAARRVRKPKYQSVAEMENAAWTEVGTFERELTVSRVNDLWKKINAATKETLKSQYEANMLSKTQYDAAKDQFKYYVPLRGFSDTTAEDIWSYYVDIFRKPGFVNHPTMFYQPYMDGRRR